MLQVSSNISLLLPVKQVFSVPNYLFGKCYFRLLLHPTFFPSRNIQRSLGSHLQETCLCDATVIRSLKIFFIFIFDNFVNFHLITRTRFLLNFFSLSSFMKINISKNQNHCSKTNRHFEMHHHRSVLPFTATKRSFGLVRKHPRRTPRRLTRPRRPRGS